MQHLTRPITRYLLDVFRIKLGVDYIALSWFATYLKPRSCKVNIEDRYLLDRDLQFPQGSLCGQVLCSAYALTLHEVVPPSLDINGFLDDHSFKDSFKASSTEEKLHTIRNLGNCTKDVKGWMDKNCLKMNGGKTEFNLFGSAI